MNHYGGRPRIADPFKPAPEHGLIDWLGARRPATIIVMAMAAMALFALIPAAFLSGAM